MKIPECNIRSYNRGNGNVDTQSRATTDCRAVATMSGRKSYTTAN